VDWSRQERSDVGVLSRPGEDEQGLAAQLVEPGGNGGEAAPRRERGELEKAFVSLPPLPEGWV